MASIIRGFKIGVTKNVRFINPDFAWQSRYHDHIIRNDESFHRISEYIINNPLNWSSKGRGLQHQSFNRRVETQCIASLQNANGSTSKNKFEPQSKNLASSIRGFKIGVTKNVRLINPNFAWQPRYHDHIIRNDESFHRISEYIINNPLNWSEDQFFK